MENQKVEIGALISADLSKVWARFLSLDDFFLSHSGNFFSAEFRAAIVKKINFSKPKHLHSEFNGSSF